MIGTKVIGIGWIWAPHRHEISVWVGPAGLTVYLRQTGWRQ